MVKVIAPDAYLRPGERPVELVKIAKRGLRGEDFKAFVKRAGFRFADTVRRGNLQPDEVPVHMIAMGSTESVGPNRNADGWCQNTLRKHHGTFVKSARAYRDHRNKDPKLSYGLVKFSEYNEEMQRVELLVALNATKEAAKRNDGLVADDELEALDKRGEYPVSMACRVAHDVCAGCANRAKNRSEYCLGEDEGGHCKRGGCRNRLGFVHDDGFINYVDNPNPVFFDISKVYRGADRTAWATGIVKAASERFVGGAELAEHLGIQDSWELEFPAGASPIEKLAARLDLIERAGDDYYDPAVYPGFRSPLAPLPGADSPMTIKAALSLLGDYQIVLPLRPWLELVHGPKEAAAYHDMIAESLPGIMGRMLADGSLRGITGETARLDKYGAAVDPRWAMALVPDYSLNRHYLEERVKRAALRGWGRPATRGQLAIKTAGAAEPLARGFALYQLLTLRSVESRDRDFDLTSRIAVRQNRF
jgi:hypothetical protein